MERFWAMNNSPLQFTFCFWRLLILPSVVMVFVALFFSSLKAGVMAITTNFNVGLYTQTV